MKPEIVQQKIDGGNPIVISTNKEILYLTLTKKWFNQIAKGIKKVEYIEVNDHWISRLFDRNGIPIPYHCVFFRNGYRENAPVLKVDYNGVVGISDFEGVECFELSLGDVLDDWGRNPLQISKNRM